MEVVRLAEIHLGDAMGPWVHIGRCEQVCSREGIQPEQAEQCEHIIELERVDIPTKHFRHVEGVVVKQRVRLYHEYEQLSEQLADAITCELYFKCFLLVVVKLQPRELPHD